MATKPTLPAIGPLAGVFAFISILAASGLVMLMSTAASNDYRWLWWTTLPVAGIQTAGAAAYCIRVTGWSRGTIVTFAGLAALTFLDLSMRVWTRP